ncbi:TlpA family protein disulfide reductase [Capsulimonas corticalis]|nr:TlpA disulfide reductase family protein [Capsulimonas corticalis]
MPLSIGTPLPSLAGATGWLGDSFATNAIHGSPLLVQFWAISCPVCRMNAPHLLGLIETYRDQGLQLLSVHMPRMESDMDVADVRVEAESLGLTGPCAVDNEHTIGDLFQTGGVWPCYFLFDAQGKLRSRAAGQLGLKMAENSLKRMLALEPAL